MLNAKRLLFVLCYSLLDLLARSLRTPVELRSCQGSSGSRMFPCNEEQGLNFTQVGSTIAESFHPTSDETLSFFPQKEGIFSQRTVGGRAPWGLGQCYQGWGEDHHRASSFLSPSAEQTLQPPQGGGDQGSSRTAEKELQAAPADLR